MDSRTIISILVVVAFVVLVVFAPNIIDFITKFFDSSKKNKDEKPRT